MTYGSLFSGCKGADIGLERAGLKPLWGCEFDQKCREVIRFHDPQLTVYPDVRTFPVLDAEVPDVLWMSPPCQDLSVAGKRAGLAGERSGLFYDAVRIATGLRDRGLRFILMEQVPGLFSSDGGEDIRQALFALLDLGSSVSWRVLDSQWFGVPQRRRRAFFVIDLRGDGGPEILALAQGLRGDSTPCREAGQRIAASLTAGPHGSSNAPGRRREDGVNLVPDVAHTLSANGFDASEDGTGRGTPLVAVPLTTSGGTRCDYDTETFIPFDPHQITSPDNRTKCEPGSPNGSLHGRGTMAVASQMAVRRLTPRECERLQSFPDDWTRYGRKEDGTVFEMADGPRYKMCGNAVTSNVAEWIGRNLIRYVEALSGDNKGVRA